MKRLILCFAIFLSGHLTTKAIIIPNLDLTQLTQESTYILAGKIIKVQEVGRITISLQGKSFTAQNQIAEIQVTRWLKGQVNSNTVTFQVIQPDVYLGYGTVTINQYGLFFLKKGAGSTLTVSNPYYPSVVAAPENPLRSNDHLNDVITEITNALISSRTSTSDKIKTIKERVKNNL